MALPRPAEPEPFVFSFLVTIYEGAPLWVREGLSAFFFTLSPDVPVDLRDHFKDAGRRQILAKSLVAAFVCCFVVTGLLCWTQGTLYGGDPRRLYFLRDWWNIGLYTVICPLYVAGAVGVIVTTFQHWSTVNTFAAELSGAAPQTKAGGRFGIALFVILLICGLAISSYMYDSLNTQHVAELYWFMEDGGPVRGLNLVGYYYILLNFVLLFITALAVFCFFSLAMEVMSVGKALANGGVDRFKILRERLEAFTHVYLLTKFIAAMYMINTIVWKDSPLGGDGVTVNMLVSGVLLTIIGVFFIAVPRLYVELKWYDYKLRIARDPDADDSFDDLRPRGIRLGSHLLDLLIIGSFVGAFWGLEFNPLGWLRSR